jgi:nucleoside-diphosphate-sugar epimerase
MSVKDIQAVTGAFGFSGKYIARRLLDKGHQVITLTDSAQRVNPFAGKVKAYPFSFDIPERLAESLKKEKNTIM